MRIKHFCRIIVFVGLTAFAWSCKSDEMLDAKPGFEMLIVEKEMTFSATESNCYVKVAADCHWDVTDVKSDNWDDLVISPRAGDGNGTLTLITGENKSSLSRSVAITLTTRGGLHQTISVQQTKSDADLSINQLEFAFNDSEETQYLVISSNGNWEISGLEGVSWLEFGQTSGGIGVFEIPIKVREAGDDVSRSVSLTVTSDDNKVDFQVSQSGRSTILLSVQNALEPFSYGGGSQTVSVECNASWRAYVSPEDQEWIRLEPASGNGNGQVLITCERFMGTSDRKGVVVMVAGSQNPQQVEILVDQTAPPSSPSVDDNPNPQFTR